MEDERSVSRMRVCAITILLVILKREFSTVQHLKTASVVHGLLGIPRTLSGVCEVTALFIITLDISISFTLTFVMVQEQLLVKLPMP